MGNHKTKGTKEWSEHSFNIMLGCPNNCIYCYAKRIWEHFRKPKIYAPTEWQIVEPNYRTLSQKFSKKKKGIVMCPTSHDITDDKVFLDKEKIEFLKNEKKISSIQYKRLIKLYNENPERTIVELCILKYKELLEIGNKLLIVTKPRLNCIKKMAKALWKYRTNVEFRFTITSINNDLIKEYENNSPLFEERLQCLQYLSKFKKSDKTIVDYNKKQLQKAVESKVNFSFYITSVSLEPCLDKNPIPLIKRIHPYINGTIWFGIMSGYSYQYHNIENLNQIINDINNLPKDILIKMRLKDSVKDKGFKLNNK